MIIEKAPVKIKKFIEELGYFSIRDITIINLRGNGKWTQEQIGRFLKMTPERVRQIEDKIIIMIDKLIKKVEKTNK